MKNTILKIGFLGMICLSLLSLSTVVFAQSVPQVQTNSATSISDYQATLNGYLSYTSDYTTSVYFQWGTTINYGSQTNQVNQSSVGSFTQVLSSLSPNTTYHFRAVAQNSYGVNYGQDMIFYSSSNGGYNGSGTLSVSKQVINLTSKNLNWQASVNANPGDVLTFAVTLQAQNQDIHNVVFRDVLPANLIYKGNLLVNATLNYSGDINSGINIGTIPANNIAVVSYQAQVAPNTSIAYGTTTLSNNATITSQEAGTQTATASVLVNKTQTYGPTYVATGLTNDPIKDSFFFPIMLIIMGSYLYFSGNIYKFADWLDQYI